MIAPSLTIMPCRRCVVSQHELPDDSLVLFQGYTTMNEVAQKLNLIDLSLTRYASRNHCSQSTLVSAAYIAMLRCYKGEGYKNSIRLGKRIIDQHLVWEKYHD